jgi:hypothetical protein
VLKGLLLEAKTILLLFKGENLKLEDAFDSFRMLYVILLIFSPYMGLGLRPSSRPNVLCLHRWME